MKKKLVLLFVSAVMVCSLAGCGTSSDGAAGNASASSGNNAAQSNVTENTNNISTPHLHFGLQLIFDESQKEGNNEIWVNCYELVKFLHMNQCQVVKVEGTKEWTRVYEQEEDGQPEKRDQQ